MPEARLHVLEAVVAREVREVQLQQFPHFTARVDPFCLTLLSDLSDNGVEILVVVCIVLYRPQVLSSTVSVNQ